MPAFIQQNPTSHSVTDADAEICLNTWIFLDSTGMVIRIAAKAYALKGTDEEKLAILKSLAGTDHLSATQGRIPTKYIAYGRFATSRAATPDETIQEHQPEKPGRRQSRLPEGLAEGLPEGGPQALGKRRIPRSDPTGKFHLPAGLFRKRSVREPCLSCREVKHWESGVEDYSEYLRHLIANADAENLTDRAILREIKLLVKILTTSVCRRALAQLEIAPGTLIPWNRMETCGLGAVAAFAGAQRNSPGTEQHGCLRARATASGWLYFLPPLTTTPSGCRWPGNVDFGIDSPGIPHMGCLSRHPPACLAEFCSVNSRLRAEKT